MRTRFQQLAACWLSAGVLLAAAQSESRVDSTPAHIQQLSRDHVIRTETLSRPGSSAIELVVASAPNTPSQPIVEGARQAIERFGGWLGPLPIERLTIVDLPVHVGLDGAAYPGLAVISVRWLSGRRDFTLDRDLSAAIARQYALRLAHGPAPESWLAEGLAVYLATRAEELRFDPRPSLTPRYFGGFVPHSIRAIVPDLVDPQPRLSEIDTLLQPADAPWRLARGADLARARRLAIALHSLERLIGWPAMQAALASFMRSHDGGTPGVDDLQIVLSQQRGSSLAWFFDQSMGADSPVDYAVVTIDSVPAADKWATTVEIRRLGEAAFARALPVVVRFEDGSEINESIDGREREWRFEYTSASPAAMASVDPDAMLLLDADRTNNTRTVNAPRSRIGVRLAFNWLTWLQDAMLTCTAVL